MQRASGLRRYWIHLGSPSELPIGFRMGAGVTAFTRDDAIALLLKVWPIDAEGPVILDVSEDIDLTVLDQSHILPNVGDVTRRGVWFPNLN